MPTFNFKVHEILWYLHLVSLVLTGIYNSEYWQFEFSILNFFSSDDTCCCLSLLLPALPKLMISSFPPHDSPAL